jgi:cell fate regulator YaaT (PSP1 superfamily)
MAKTQGLSLNPTKISGICGRLMCCLSYENEFYSEISTKMPKLNARVKTKDGIGSVIYNNLLKQKVTVKIESDNDIKISEYSVDEIEVLPKINPQEKQKEPIKKDAKEEKPENKENKKFNKFNKKKKHNESKDK